jgi:hypothetical protein
MHNASANLDNLLQRPAQFVVPFVALFDDSTFGNEVRRALNETAEAEFMPAVLQGDSASPEGVLGDLLAVGFQQRLAPLRMWPEQPAWCAWFLGKTGISPDDVGRAIECCASTYPSGVEHVVVVCLEDPKAWRDWTNFKKPSLAVELLLVCDNGAAKRPIPLLATASAAHVYAAWVNHCKTGSGDSHKHLLVTPDHTTHTLGMSVCVPDVAYHAERWSRFILSALLREWNANATCLESATPFEPALSSLKFLVPNATGQSTPDYTVAPADSSWETPRISVGDESFSVSGEFTALSCRRPERRQGSRAQLLSWLSAIKGLASFLGFSTVPNLKQLLDHNAPTQGSRWLQAAKDFLGQPANVSGFLATLRSRLEQTATWAAQRLNSSLEDSNPSGDFRHCECAALAKISGIPSPAGLLLRLILIGLALGSMAMFPLWPPASVHTWQTELAHRIAWGSAASFVLMSLFAAGCWYYSAWRALQAVVQARTAVIQKHLSTVAGLIVGAVAENGRRLSEDVAKWGKAFDELRRTLEDDTRNPAEIKVPNKNSFFPDATLDTLCLKRLPVIVAQAHKSFLADFDASTLTTFQVEQWRQALAKTVHKVAHAEVNQLTFAEWMTELNPTSEQKKHLTEDLVREARLPSLNMRQPANPPPVLFVGAHDLATHNRGLGHITSFDSGQHSLVAVAVIPILQEGTT